MKNKLLEEVLELNKKVTDLSNHLIIFNKAISFLKQSHGITIEGILDKAYLSCRDFNSFKRLVNVKYKLTDDELRNWYNDVNSKLN